MIQWWGHYQSTTQFIHEFAEAGSRAGKNLDKGGIWTLRKDNLLLCELLPHTSSSSTVRKSYSVYGIWTQRSRGLLRVPCVPCIPQPKYLGPAWNYYCTLRSIVKRLLADFVYSSVTKSFQSSKDITGTVWQSTHRQSTSFFFNLFVHVVLLSLPLRLFVLLLRFSLSIGRFSVSLTSKCLRLARLSTFSCQPPRSPFFFVRLVCQIALYQAVLAFGSTSSINATSSVALRFEIQRRLYYSF